MFVNKNYEDDINYVYNLNRIVFSLLGIWPYTQTNYWYLQLKRTVLLLMLSFFLGTDLLSMILYIFMVQKETRARLKLMASLIYSIVAIFKYSNLLYIKNRLINCLTCIEQDFRDVASPTARNMMLFHAKTSRLLFIVCSIFAYVTVIAYRAVIPLSKGNIVTPENITIRPLACPAHFVVFDPQISPAYEIVFFVQFLTSAIKGTITVAACGIAALFTMHIVAQLEILTTAMNALTSKEKLENVNKALSVIVEHQIKTRNLLHMVQDIIQFSSLLEVLTSSFLVCFLLYHLLMEWEANNALAMYSYLITALSFGCNIFIYCFIGEQLSEMAEQVALTACTLDWYLLPDTKARALILIIIMSNIPLRLKAGNFVDLSYRTFGAVVRTTLGYLNLLRAVVVVNENVIVIFVLILFSGSSRKLIVLTLILDKLI